MIVVLSQRVDIETEYADELFMTYHYPSRYRNQIQVGDIFVYYQGNRHNKEQRYYFGSGVILEIITSDDENYYAKLGNCIKFSQLVPIYLPEGGYVEQLGYQEIRKSINPPWQSSIRPLSEDAYRYIIKHSGVQEDIVIDLSVDELKEQLKKSVRSFYLAGEDSAILEIKKTAEVISKALKLSKEENVIITEFQSHIEHDKSIQDRTIESLLYYCTDMKMSYSYKPLLIMAYIEMHDENWKYHINDAAIYFKKYYQHRRDKGLTVEKMKCIYQDPDITLKEISSNLITNPVKALSASGFFEFESNSRVILLHQDLVNEMNENNAEEIKKICKMRLDRYYLSINGTT